MCPQTLCGPRTVGRGCDDDGMPATDRDPRSAPGDAEPNPRVAIRALVVEDEVEMAKVIGSSKHALWKFSLHAPSYLPVMQYAENRDLRKTPCKQQF